MLTSVYNKSHFFNYFIRGALSNVPDCEFICSTRFTSCVFLDISVGQQDVLFLADEFHKITKTSAIAAFRIEVIKNCLKVVVFIVP